MIDYQVAIPSYQRAETLRDNTLTLLNARGVNAGRIAVFVADERQAEVYAHVLDPGTYREIIVAEPGLHRARNFINRHYGRERVVQADDDLRDLVRLYTDDDMKERTHPVSDIDSLIRECFAEVEREGLTLWGVGAVANPFFMRYGYTTSLKLMVGAFWGALNDPGADYQQVPFSEKEDYERTLRHWDHAGGVLRRCDTAVVTRFYTEPGGMQVERTVEDSHVAAARLMAAWPGLVRMNPRRKGPRAEVLLSTRKRKGSTPSVG